jgi:signal transduction histidine kinase
MIDLEGRRLADQVGQVLAFARMQASRPRLDLRALDAGRQVAEVVRELRPTLESAGVELVPEVEEGLPPVWAEGQALRQCLSNLVVNGIKYGQRPGAEPWVGLDVGAVGDRVRFRVRDRGPGIDPRDRPHLFEPFYRGRGMAASAVPGSGLGLALVRHLVEAQGGRIGLESEPGQGTEVWIELPTAERGSTTGEDLVKDSVEVSR